MDYESQCLSDMHSNGLPFGGPLKCDGRLHRFSVDAKKSQPDEWYLCHKGVSEKGNPYLTCCYGSWSGGQEKYTYKSYDSSSTFSSDEIIDIRAKEEENRKLFEKQQKEDRERRIKQARNAWEEAIEEPALPDHSAYLNRKQVSAYGIKYRVEYDGSPIIVIPLCNTEGELQAIQCIQKDGTKRIYGAKKGNFHVIGKIQEHSPVYITEGYATGASIHQAIGHSVVIAIDCGNLKAVVSSLREKYPRIQLVIAADDDVESSGNPGRTKAEAAAKYAGCSLVFPVFPDDFRLSNGKCPTDFNDLHVHFGIQKVVDQLKIPERPEVLVKETVDLQNEQRSEKFTFRSASSLIQQPPKANWLIKPYVDAGSLSVLFGEPGSMKSFLAIDMGYCIATGCKWHGMPVRKQGAVFYIAGEGFAGLSKRFRAWAIANSVDPEKIPFFVSDRPAQLLDAISVAEVTCAIDEMVKLHGQPIFVIIDTLNRNFGPGDENRTEDMTAFVNSVDSAIRARYGCAVLIVHHSPLNDPKRARGASSLRGALDWEYCLTRYDKNTRKLSATKVKDYEIPSDLYFQPKSVILDGWIDEQDGEVMSSCVLERKDCNSIKGDVEALSSVQKTVLDCLIQLESGSSVSSEGIHIDSWRMAAYQAGISVTGTQESKKKAFKRAIESLSNKGLVVVANNDFWKSRDRGQGQDTSEACLAHVNTGEEGQTRHFF
jgi:putative DNA primase/helicase